MAEKSLFEYKLGEELDKDLFNGLMKKPCKLVKIGYTFQNKEGIKMECVLKTKDFIEDDKESDSDDDMDVVPDEEE